MSATTIAGRPPEQQARHPATCSSAADVRPLIATCTPASASAAAIPLPIPPLAAVMRAVLPSRPSFIRSTPCADDAAQAQSCFARDQEVIVFRSYLRWSCQNNSQRVGVVLLGHVH